MKVPGIYFVYTGVFFCCIETCVFNRVRDISGFELSEYATRVKRHASFRMVFVKNNS